MGTRSGGGSRGGLTGNESKEQAVATTHDEAVAAGFREVRPGTMAPHFYDDASVDGQVMLTRYSYQKVVANGGRVFQIDNLPAGYALWPNRDGDGQGVEMFMVHNNSGIPGLGDDILHDAIARGADRLFAFDNPKLTALYTEHGFREYDRIAWDPQYAPERWAESRYAGQEIDVHYMRRET
jgi:hypothetical protein